MGETAMLVVNVMFLILLVNSVGRFIVKAKGEHEAPRLLGALSSATTLLAVCLIYSGQFRRNGMLAARHWSSEPETIENIDRWLTNLDHGAIGLANILSPGPDVGYRPIVTVTPAVLLAGAYLLRWLIYFNFERRGLDHGAATGSAYWSHISAYLMTVSFLILVAGWNVYAVVGGSVVLVSLLLVGLLLFLEDVMVAVLAIGFTVKNLVASAARAITRLAVGIAGLVRAAFRRAHTWYAETISNRIRSVSRKAVESSSRLNDAQRARLEAQNAKQKDRFSG